MNGNAQECMGTHDNVWERTIMFGKARACKGTHENVWERTAMYGIAGEFI